MSVKAILCTALFFSGLMHSPLTLGDTWYVNAAATEPRDGKALESGFETIQEGIDAAINGDTVLVAEGVYYENIDFRAKNIALRSTDPLNADVVANTIIDGGADGSVVTFSGTENPTCVLSGFTICSGEAHAGGGILGDWSRATIENNVITGNSADWSGGGLFRCHGTIRNNIIYGNSAAGEHGTGGGLFFCEGTVENNTIVGNRAGKYGGGLYDCDGTIRNCIIWGNSATFGLQIYGSSQPTYSCIKRWADAGEGNTAHYPYFLDRSNGDYHLKRCSPCIDAGDPTSPFSEEPEPNGGRINMGAYGNTPEATSASPDSDQDGLPDD